MDLKVGNMTVALLGFAAKTSNHGPGNDCTGMPSCYETSPVATFRAQERCICGMDVNADMAYI